MPLPGRVLYLPAVPSPSARWRPIFLHPTPAVQAQRQRLSRAKAFRFRWFYFELPLAAGFGDLDDRGIFRRQFGRDPDGFDLGVQFAQPPVEFLKLTQSLRCERRDS